MGELSEGALPGDGYAVEHYDVFTQSLSILVKSALMASTLCLGGSAVKFTGVAGPNPLGKTSVE